MAPETASTCVDLEGIQLLKGSHKGPDAGMCVMEAFTYVNRLPFSDRPACVCPTLAAFLRHWNDNVADGPRQELLKYLPRLSGTNDGKTVDRAWMLIDWLYRERLPEFLETLDDAKAKECAAGLRGLHQIKASAELELAIPFIKGAALSINNFALALDRALDRALARALALDRALALALDLDLALDLARALDLALALARQATPGGGSASDSADGDGAGEVEGQLQISRATLMERMLAA